MPPLAGFLGKFAMIDGLFNLGGDTSTGVGARMPNSLSSGGTTGLAGGVRRGGGLNSSASRFIVRNAG